MRHWRLHLFYRLLGSFSQRARRARMRSLLERVRLADGGQVLDLGGQPKIWQDVPRALQITILNLPGIANDANLPQQHRFEFVEGDACAVSGPPDRRYDFVFSNSVIEHVGPEPKQDAFAREVRRLGPSYWVQTPAIWFPVEAHTGMPLWWFYPQALRRALLRRWRQKTPEWTEMVEGTRVLTLERLRALFPEAQIHVERVLGIPKSYSAWYVAGHDARPTAQERA